MQRPRLTRHFALASLAAFVLFGLLIHQVESLRSKGLQAIQREERKAVADLQADLLKEVTDLAQRDMIEVHESNHLSMARLLANLAWNDAMSGYFARAGQIDFAACEPHRPNATPQVEEQRQVCYRSIGQQLQFLPQFQAVDERLRQAMRATQIFRLKVFDQRGITVYSTDASQIGEDRSHSAGWRSAALNGRPQTHLTLNQTVDPLHGQMERRDLVNSYLPVYVGMSSFPVAVIETYGDVSAFMAKVTDTTDRIGEQARAREDAMVERLGGVLTRLDEDGTRSTGLLLVLTVILYGVLQVIARRTQREFEAQAEQVQASRTHLMQTEKMAMLGQMVAGVAHQLNTPLAFCRTNLQIAGDVVDRWMCRHEQEQAATVLLADAEDRATAHLVPDEEVAEARHMLEDTLGGVRMMEELVEQLRGFTRLDQALHDTVELNEAISNVVYIARTVVSPKVRIDERYASLPRLRVNVSQVNQAVLNLLMNAAQSIEGAGTVTVQTLLDESSALIVVSDTGCGIDPAIQGRVFEPFFTTKAAAKGTGLGLSLVQDIVRMHGGQVDLSSQRGRGTTVTIRLPLAQGVI